MARCWPIDEAERKTKALENAFRAIKSRDNIGVDQDEIFISDIGRRLWLMKPRESRDQEFDAVWPLPPEDKKQARNLAIKAAESLRRVSPAAAHEMGLNRVNLFVLRHQLESAVTKLKPVRGAPRKDQVRKIGEVVAIHYWALTGNKPTVPKNGDPYGPFLDLMTAVFKILDIEDSPLSTAEAASRRWNRAKKHLGLGMEFNREESADLIPLLET